MKRLFPCSGELPELYRYPRSLNNNSHHLIQLPSSKVSCRGKPMLRVIELSNSSLLCYYIFLNVIRASSLLQSRETSLFTLGLGDQHALGDWEGKGAYKYFKINKCHILWVGLVYCMNVSYLIIQCTVRIVVLIKFKKLLIMRIGKKCIGFDLLSKTTTADFFSKNLRG